MTLNGVLQPVGVFSLWVPENEVSTAWTDFFNCQLRHVDQHVFYDVAIRLHLKNGVVNGITHYYALLMHTESQASSFDNHYNNDVLCRRKSDKPV